MRLLGRSGVADPRYAGRPRARKHPGRSPVSETAASLPPSRTRGRRTHQRATQSPIADSASRPSRLYRPRRRPGRDLMTQYRLRTTALDEAGCAAVHAATLEVLEKTGVEVQHDGALALLARAGAKVDGTRVRMPAGAGRRRPRRRAAQRPARRRARRAGGLELKAGPVYYGTGSDCLVLPRPGRHATGGRCRSTTSSRWRRCRSTCPTSTS